MKRFLTLACFLCLSIAPLAERAVGNGEATITDATVEAELDEGSDRQIKERLQASLKALPGLAGVSVDVEAGIVVLGGEVDSVRLQELAGKLAAQVSGVVAVENGIRETRSVKRRLSIAMERLETRAWSFLGSLPVLLLALGAIGLSMLLARLLSRWDGLLRRLTDNAFLRDLSRQLIRVAVVGAGVLLALEILDATALVGAALGAAGVVGLAVGFAFRDLIENYIASVLLSLRQPFSPHDLVRIGDHEGRVARLTSRATILVTAEGNHVRIPNGIVFKSTIENLTREPERRFSVGVSVAVEEDLVAAQDLGVETLHRMDGVLDTPAPSVQIEALGDSSVVLTVHGWVDQNLSDFNKVRSEATRLVKQAFDRQGIEMPEPIHRLRIENASQPKPPAPQPSGDETRDVSRDAHLDALVRTERFGDEDLLEENGVQE